MRTQKITFLFISLLFSWLSMSAQYQLTVIQGNLLDQGMLQVSANGLTGPYEVTWPNGQQVVLESNITVTSSNFNSGTYNVSIKNRYGCEKILTATIGNPEQRIGHVTDNINIYPNPNTGEFFIEIDGAFSAHPQSLMVQDISGKTIKIIDLPEKIEAPVAIDLTEVVNGIYMISLQTGNELISERIVISK